MASTAGSLPPLLLLSKFAAGAVLMRSAGCVVNDMLDHQYDRQVTRTRDRPLAARSMTMPQATVVLAGLLTSSLGILLTFDPLSIALGASSVLIVCVYPLMKRYMDWPQLVLGLAFNFGAILGWSTVRESVDWAAVLPLYGAGVSWTIFYDTIYAHQDKTDDRRVGIRSTALLFGDQYAKLYLGGFATSAVSLLALSGWSAGLHSVYYTGVGCAALHMAYQIYSVDLNSRSSCANTFLSNTHLGAILTAAVFLDRILY